MMDDEQENDLPASTAEVQWKRDTFYSVIDTIQVSTKQRFEKNRLLLKSFALFLPRPASKIQGSACSSSRYHEILCSMHSDAQRSHLALQRHSVSSIALQ